MITITTKATAHDSVFAAAPTRRGKWVEAGFDVECDRSAGEKYIQDTSGNLPSISQCKRSCEISVQCQSITYLNTGWCSHFSTPCTNRKETNEAVSMRFSTSGRFFICGVAINFLRIKSRWYS